MLLSRGMGSSHFIKVYLLTPTGSLACKPLKLCITSTLHILMGMFPKFPSLKQNLLNCAFLRKLTNFNLYKYNIIYF